MDIRDFWKLVWMRKILSNSTDQSSRRFLIACLSYPQNRQGISSLYEVIFGSRQLVGIFDPSAVRWAVLEIATHHLDCRLCTRRRAFNSLPPLPLKCFDHYFYGVVKAHRVAP